MAIPSPAGITPTSGGIGGSGNFTVNLPSGAVGYLAAAQWLGTTTQCTPPSGWSVVVPPGTSGPDDYPMYGVWKADTSTSPGTTWNHGTSNGAAAVIIVGYDGALTEDVLGGTNNSHTSPSVNTSEAALIARILFRQTYSSAPTLTYPSGHTLGQVQRSQSAAGEWWAVGIAHVEQASSGATGTAVWSSTGTAWYPRAQTIALTTEAAETPSGGSVVGVATATVQAGQSVRSGASTAGVPVAAVGSGTKATAGSSTAAVGVTSTAQGSTVRSGGSVATVGATAVQAGTTARTGGSTAGVDTTAASAGETVRSGSSVAGVDVATVGAGAPVESGQGGSVTGVSIGAVGAGCARRAGSSAPSVSITTVGGGTAVQPGQGGSVVGVGVTTVGAGRKVAAAASVAHVTTTTLGAGWAARHGAGITGVLVAAVVGGHNPASFRDITVTAGPPQGHPLTIGAPAGHTLDVGGPQRHALDVGAPSRHALNPGQPSRHPLTASPPRS